jgi:hypothetical protein
MKGTSLRLSQEMREAIELERKRRYDADGVIRPVSEIIRDLLQEALSARRNTAKSGD